MPTDLQRIELAFPVEAMLHVVDHGADPKDPSVQRVRRLLVGTVDEALAGLIGRDLRKLGYDNEFWVLRHFPCCRMAGSSDNEHIEGTLHPPSCPCSSAFCP